MGAGSNHKSIVSAARSSGGLIIPAITFMRPAVDASQNQIKSYAPGSYTGPLGGTLETDAALIFVDTGRTLGKDGTEADATGAPAEGVNTATTFCIGGSQLHAHDRANVGIAAILVINPDLLPGGGTYNMRRVIEGWMEHDWGRSAAFAAAAPHHPFANNPPVSTDWTGKPDTILAIGNSIRAHTDQGVSTIAHYPPKRVTLAYPGETWTAIKGHFDTYVAANPRSLECNWIFGEWFVNGADVGDLLSCPDTIKLAADQVVAAGGRFLAWESWIGWLTGWAIGTPNRAALDAETATLVSYFGEARILRMSRAFIHAGAPTGPYPDPDYYPQGLPTQGLKGDSVHPSTPAGDDFARAVEDASVIAERWLR